MKRVCLGVLLLALRSFADDRLDAALDAVAPGIKKWASVCVIKNDALGQPTFAWHDYRQTASRSDFWPASAIKLYAVIAGMELLHERGFDLDTTLSFAHADTGKAQLDCARSMREMMSEIFRRSSNEDYTLLLRFTGLDRLNTQFLTLERGFPTSALMRGYVKERPWVYVREETQTICMQAAGRDLQTVTHRWSGQSYSAARGATLLDAKTGNLTSPRELADCLRRVMFHAELPEMERFKLPQDQIDFLRHGGMGFTGLETTSALSGPSAWTNGVARIFPRARFYHKSGLISDYALDVAYVDDSKQSGCRFILVPVVNAGHASKPVDGETLIGEMSFVLARWAAP